MCNTRFIAHIITIKKWIHVTFCPRSGHIWSLRMETKINHNIQQMYLPLVAMQCIIYTVILNMSLYRIINIMSLQNMPQIDRGIRYMVYRYYH